MNPTRTHSWTTTPPDWDPATDEDMRWSWMSRAAVAAHPEAPFWALEGLPRTPGVITALLTRDPASVDAELTNHIVALLTGPVTATNLWLQTAAGLPLLTTVHLGMLVSRITLRVDMHSAALALATHPNADPIIRAAALLRCRANGRAGPAERLFAAHGLPEAAALALLFGNDPTVGKLPLYLTPPEVRWLLIKATAKLLTLAGEPALVPILASCGLGWSGTAAELIDLARSVHSPVV